MQGEIEGQATFYRQDGKWHIVLKAPDWVLRDLAQSLEEESPPILSKQGATWSGSPLTVTDMLFVAGRFFDIDKSAKSNAEKLEAIQKEITELWERIDHALTNCPICSKKPGSPTLCPDCLALRNGYWVTDLEAGKVRTSKGEMTVQEYFENTR